jgi:hypothetical protein
MMIPMAIGKEKIQIKPKKIGWIIISPDGDVQSISAALRRRDFLVHPTKAYLVS